MSAGVSPSTRVVGRLRRRKRIRTLERELARKEQALAEAAALLMLKKVETLCGEGEEDDIDEEMSVEARGPNH